MDAWLVVTLSVVLVFALTALVVSCVNIATQDRSHVSSLVVDGLTTTNRLAVASSATAGELTVYAGTRLHGGTQTDNLVVTQDLTVQGALVIPDVEIKVGSLTTPYISSGTADPVSIQPGIDTAGPVTAGTSVSAPVVDSTTINTVDINSTGTASINALTANSAHVAGDLGVQGGLDVGGPAVLHSTLNTLGALTAAGAVAINNALGVTGPTTLQSVTAQNGLQVTGGTLGVSVPSSFTDTATFDNADVNTLNAQTVTITGSLSAPAAYFPSITTDTLTANNNVITELLGAARGDFGATQPVTDYGVAVYNRSYMAQDLYCGASMAPGSLSLETKTNAKIGGDLKVVGYSETDGNGSVGGSLDVTGTVSAATLAADECDIGGEVTAGTDNGLLNPTDVCLDARTVAKFGHRADVPAHTIVSDVARDQIVREDSTVLGIAKNKRIQSPYGIWCNINTSFSSIGNTHVLQWRIDANARDYFTGGTSTGLAFGPNTNVGTNLQNVGAVRGLYTFTVVLAVPAGLFTPYPIKLDRYNPNTNIQDYDAYNAYITYTVVNNVVCATCTMIWPWTPAPSVPYELIFRVETLSSSAPAFNGATLTVALLNELPYP